MSIEPFETIRPLLVSVDGDDTVRVALEHGRELFVAEVAVGDGEDDGRGAAAGRATVDALGQLTPAAVSFSLDWCRVVATGDELPDLVTVLVGVDVAGAAMRYAGAVVVSGDVAEAAAKAVLDALNRRLGVTGL